MDMSTLTKRQVKRFSKAIPLKEFGYDETGTITAEVRYDDKCGNGHNSFSITGEIRRNDKMRDPTIMCGCIHEEIEKHFPELAKYLKWHFFDSTGPMYYVENTVYLAGDRDCHGLRKDEKRQIRNGKTGQLAWELVASEELPRYVDADEQPTGTTILSYVPWCHVGEGKERELDAARRSAVWPEATDEELSASKEELTQALRARLPALLEEFKAAVEELEFVY